MRRRPTLVAIGRLSAEKGFANLIEAFARANRGARRHAPAAASSARGPSAQRSQQRIAALGLQERVTLAGYVEGADRLLGTAAGFVMSSLTEGMPLVLLEAMQWRVPILATCGGRHSGAAGGRTRGRAGAARRRRGTHRGLRGDHGGARGAMRAAARAAVPSTIPAHAWRSDYLRLYEAIT